MNLEYFFDNVSRREFYIKSIPNYLEINNLYELFELIKPTIPKYEIIEQWHQLLMQYINDDDAVFFIRRYQNAPKNNVSQIRRGYLTEYADGLKYVYCDNNVAQYFYIMAIHEFVPTYNDFIDTIKNRKFPISSRVNKGEIPHQAFHKGKSNTINKFGWKLSHIYSINYNYDYNFNYNTEKNLLYPRGNENEWVVGRHEYPSKFIESYSVNEQKEKTIATFLRLVHPINYFLTPQRKHTNSNVDLGEIQSLINLVKQEHCLNVPDIFNKFKQLAKVEDNQSLNENNNEKLNVTITY